MTSSTSESLVALVRRGAASAEAFDAIESARDLVQPQHLPVLVASYPTLDWEQRRALVLLIQDLIDERTRPLMLDFLVGSPEGDDVERDSLEVARAIALCHVERDLERFDTYLEDRELLARQRERLRAKARGDQ